MGIQKRFIFRPFHWQLPLVHINTIQKKIDLYVVKSFQLIGVGPSSADLTDSVCVAKESFAVDWVRVM